MCHASALRQVRFAAFIIARLTSLATYRVQTISNSWINPGGGGVLRCCQTCEGEVTTVSREWGQQLLTMSRIARRFSCFLASRPLRAVLVK